MLIIMKYNSVWLKQGEDLAWREHADGPVPQLDILSGRNVLTILEYKMQKSAMKKVHKFSNEQSIGFLIFSI